MITIGCNCYMCVCLLLLRFLELYYTHNATPMEGRKRMVEISKCIGLSWLVT